MKKIIKKNQSVVLFDNENFLREAQDMEIYTNQGFSTVRGDKIGWVAICATNKKGQHSVLLDLDRDEAFNLAFQLMDAIRIFDEDK